MATTKKPTTQTAPSQENLRTLKTLIVEYEDVFLDKPVPINAGSKRTLFLTIKPVRPGDRTSADSITKVGDVLVLKYAGITRHVPFSSVIAATPLESVANDKN